MNRRTAVLVAIGIAAWASITASQVAAVASTNERAAAIQAQIELNSQAVFTFTRQLTNP